MQNFPLILFFGSFWPTAFSQCQNCREFSLNLEATTDKEGDVLLNTLKLKNQTLKRFNLFKKKILKRLHPATVLQINITNNGSVDSEFRQH